MSTLQLPLAISVCLYGAYWKVEDSVHNGFITQDNRRQILVNKKHDKWEK